MPGRAPARGSPGGGSSSSYCMRCSRRPSTWMRACSRTRSSAPSRGPSSGRVERQRESPSDREGRRPSARVSARRWRAEIPATRRGGRPRAAAVTHSARPAADVAVLDGLGIRARSADMPRASRRPSWPRTDRGRCGSRPCSRRRAASRPSARCRRGRRAATRADALDRLELVDVRADLQDGARLDVPRELGVGDLVVVRAPDRRSLGVVDPQQEVGVAAPAAVEERRLVDDVGARRHRLDRRGCGGAEPLAVVLDRSVAARWSRRGGPRPRSSAR